MAAKRKIKEEPLDDNNDCNCIIETLLKTKFSFLSLNEKQTIVQNSRPKPFLDIRCQTKKFQRYFNSQIYDKLTWICGCPHLVKFFCWPCLLFSHDFHSWNTHGFSDLNNMNKASKRHECSQSHISASIQLIKFKKNIEDPLSIPSIENIESHNKEVAANRYVILKLITVISFFVQRELSVQTHFENSESKYVEFLHLLSESDVKLQSYLENSTMDIWSQIQNDLIPTIANVLLNTIKTEIQTAKFVSVIFNEFIGIDQKVQFSTIFRYVNENNNIQERFIGFLELKSDTTPEALFNYIQDIVVEFGCKEKLIAQSNDGATIMSGANGVQQKIENICPKSLFVHCYDHELNQVLSQSVKKISRCRHFFKNLLLFGSFFCKYLRKSSLDYKIIVHISTITSVHLENNFSKILDIIIDYKEELVKIFTQIKNEWDSDTIIIVGILSDCLEDFEFNFHLCLFSRIFKSADYLFKVLQTKTLNISRCVNEIKSFMNFLNKTKHEFDILWSRVVRKNDKIEKMKTTYNNQYDEIIAAISVNITQRFQDIEKLKFMELLDVAEFKTYEKHFPDALFKSLFNISGEQFDFIKLKSELVYMYSCIDCSFKSISCIKDFIINNELEETFTQVSNLIGLIYTLPSISNLTEKPFSTMEKIRRFTRSNQNEERHSAFSIILMGKELILELKKNEKFYDAVIDELCKTEHRINLNYLK